VTIVRSFDHGNCWVGGSVMCQSMKWRVTDWVAQIWDDLTRSQLYQIFSLDFLKWSCLQPSISGHHGSLLPYLSKRIQRTWWRCALSTTFTQRLQAQGINR